MNEHTQTSREWLTVDEAFLACQQAGLDRTKKTIRSWARNEHLEAQKQTTPSGERWMVEKASLAVKIRAELEFQRPSELVQTRAHASEPVQTDDEPVRTRADQFDQERTTAHQAEPRQTSPEEDLRDLNAQIRSLEIDKAVRDRQIDFLTAQNEEGQKGLLSQSRYIGHLETQVMQLGGTPDQRFLQAPVPSNELSQTVHPDQAPLRPVH